MIIHASYDVSLREIINNFVCLARCFVMLICKRVYGTYTDVCVVFKLFSNDKGVKIVHSIDENKPIKIGTK